MIVAIMITTILVPFDAGSTPKMDKNPPTISFTHASASKDTTVAALPTTMNGFLLPHDKRQLSLRMPI